MTDRHDYFDWQEQLEACQRSDVYSMPVHFDGKAQNVWRVTLTGDQCRQMIERSALRR